MPPLSLSEIRTPLGQMTAIFSPDGLVLLEFSDQKQLQNEIKQICSVFQTAPQMLADTRHQHLQSELNLYFSGSLITFTTPIYPIGTTFQRQAWQILTTIPYGQTISYAQQAQQLGHPKAVRAVASANSRNKISILLPCHRVIGSNGKPTGYAGGIHRKQALLELEKQHSF